MNTKLPIRFLLLISASCSLAACKNIQEDSSANEAEDTSVKGAMVTPKKNAVYQCIYNTFPIYPLFPNVLQAPIMPDRYQSFDYEEWLLGSYVHEITDNEKKYVQSIKSYGLSSDSYFFKKDRLKNKNVKGDFAKLSYHREFFNFLSKNWRDIQFSLTKKSRDFNNAISKNITPREFNPIFAHTLANVKKSNTHFATFTDIGYDQLIDGFAKSPANMLVLSSINISLLEGNYNAFLQAIAAIKEKENEEVEKRRKWYISEDIDVSKCTECDGFVLDEHSKGDIIYWESTLWPLINVTHEIINSKDHKFYQEDDGIYVRRTQKPLNVFTQLNTNFSTDEISRIKKHGLCTDYDIRSVWDYVLYKDRDRSEFSPQDIENYETSKQIYLNADIEG